MNDDHRIKVIEILAKQDENGCLFTRESSIIEYKAKFSFADIDRYSKTMASFANKSGGYIIFGIEDSTRKIVGTDKEKFESIKQEKITDFLLENYDPEVSLEIGGFEFNNLYIGYIYIAEEDNKPVVCKNNGVSIKNGDIFYRYRAQDRKIRYAELNKIIEGIKVKERKSWMRLLKDIAIVGPENTVITNRGKLEIKISKDSNALPINIKDENLLSLYPLDYNHLVNKLKSRYSNFKINKKFHEIKNKLKGDQRYCHTRSLDPNKPNSPKKDFYSSDIINEFDKYYNNK